MNIITVENLKGKI